MRQIKICVDPVCECNGVSSAEESEDTADIFEPDLS